MSYGWLPCNPESPTIIRGVYLDKGATKTRSEEYVWAMERIPYKSTVLDAATGYVHDWHIFPQILSAVDCSIFAVDMDPLTLNMPVDKNIVRMVMDITELDFPDRMFDAVSCISTLEHMSIEAQQTFIKEAHRVLKPAGTLILTADNYPGITPDYLKDLCSDYFRCGDRDSDLPGTYFAGGKRVAYLHGFK